MNKDKLNSILTDALKIIKLIAAILMLLLGFLGEGERKMAEVDDTVEIQFSPDSALDAIAGFFVAAATGWPGLYVVGACVGNLFC